MAWFNTNESIKSQWLQQLEKEENKHPILEEGLSSHSPYCSNLPTVRVASSWVEPNSLVASQIYFPACFIVTAGMYKELVPGWDMITCSGSWLGLSAVLDCNALRGLGRRIWEGWLLIGPRLSYQRMEGVGFPVALQVKVTQSPITTLTLVGGDTIAGLEPEPTRKKK